MLSPWKVSILSSNCLGLRKVSPKLPTKLDKTRLIGLLLQALTTKITRNLGKTQPGLLETVCWNTLKHTQSESDSQKRLKVIWVALLLEISQQTYELTVMSISSTGAKRCTSSLISRSTSWYWLAKFQESTCRYIKAMAEKRIQTPFSFLNVWLVSRFSKISISMLPCHWWFQLPGHPVHCTSASLVRRDKRWTTTTAKYFQTPVRLPQHPRWLAHKSIKHHKSKGMRRIYGKLMISNLCWMIGNADLTCRRKINDDHQI